MKSATVVHYRPMKLRHGGVWAMNELPAALIYSGSSREVSAGRPIARVLPILGQSAARSGGLFGMGRSKVEGRGLHRALRRLLSYRANAI
jgi:hypothetical protein